MAELILHHYDASPFSEKVRLLMGYKQQAFSAVSIPVIMPKPGLMPLTGGYRKTPVAQVGADIYCDTALICKLIDRMYPDRSVYPVSEDAVLGSFVHWTDTFLFRVCVAVAFQPKALSNNALFQDQDAAAAFMADRAEFSRGSSELGMDFTIAEPHWLMHLRRLDQQLTDKPFLYGETPTIADFSTYHCLWFVHNNELLRDYFEPFSNVLAWRSRMAEFSPPAENVQVMSEETALDIARDASPSVLDHSGSLKAEGPKVGDNVEVMAIDYGFQPTKGILRVSSFEEIVVEREDPRVGKVAVHFPRLGFKVWPAEVRPA